MKSERLLDAIGKIDDELVYSATPSRKRPAWLKWGALAACLCIVMGGAVLVSRLGAQDSVTVPRPFRGTQTIPAEGLENGPMLGGFTAEFYDIVGEEVVGLSPIKGNIDAADLPVYHSVDTQSSDAVYELFAEELTTVQKRAQTLGIELTAGEVFGNGQAYDPDVEYSEYYMYGFDADLSGDGVQVHLSCIAEGSWLYLDWDGLEQLFNQYHELAPITTESTDEEVFAALSPVADFASELFGTEFTLDTTYLRRDLLRAENGMWARAYVTGRSGHLSGEARAYEMFEKMRYGLKIRLIEGSDGVYRLDSVSTGRQYYEYIGNYELITLEEAEELLKKGYVLSGTMCPVCSAGEPEVDFATYDAVEIIYQESGAEYLIPVYAFYKDLGMREYNDGSGEYHAYARVCVPAVEVEGMDEFFAERAAQHEELDT